MLCKTKLVETWHATSLLFAAIPHADARVHTRYAHALGMRRACVSMVQRTEAKRSP